MSHNIGEALFFGVPTVVFVVVWVLSLVYDKNEEI